MVEQPSVREFDERIAKLQIEKSLRLENDLRSNNPDDIYKAQVYLQELEKNKKKDIRSFLFDPFEAYQSTGGYKQQRKRVSFDILKKVADTPIIGQVIKTRTSQVQNFLRFTNNEQESGYTVRKKKSLFDEDSNKKKNLSDEEKKKIEYIVNFLDNGGLKSKWDITDDLSNFVGKILKDSYSYDQMAVECERNRRFELIGYNAIDASTIRLLETIDPRFREQSKQKYNEMFGQLPRYAQVYQSNIMKNPLTNEEIVFYPWELMYDQRNRSTALEKNGYGTSEIEILLDIITWSLWGMQYNGNFFKQGSNPKGFLNVKSNDVNMDVLNDFRQTWRQMLAGVNNSHKIPIFAGIDLEWVDLQMNNRDMEFQQWMEFLMIMIFSTYAIDPSELGYNFQKQAQIFGQDGQKQRLDHSKNKGLKPVLLFLERNITKSIVSEIDSDYEFVFTGIDREDEAMAVDITKKKLDAGIVPLESAFEKEMGRKLDPKKDTILNTVYQQAQQMKMYGGADQNQMVDEMTGESSNSPFDNYEGGGEQSFTPQMRKSIESNPITKECMKYVDEQLNIK